MPRGTLHDQKRVGRTRNNRPTFNDIPLERDGLTRGPSLEEATDRTVWMPATRKWWDVWRRSAQAQTFEETDWQRLSMVARIYDACVAKPSKALMEEIRMNESLLGATVSDRQRARMKITAPTSSAPADDDSDADVISLDDYPRR